MTMNTAAINSISESMSEGNAIPYLGPGVLSLGASWTSIAWFPLCPGRASYIEVQRAPQDQDQSDSDGAVH